MKSVAVTGMGVVTPIGNDVASFTEALFAGRSGAGPIRRFDPGQLPTRFAAEVKGVESEYRDVKITYALLAARQAMRQAFGSERPELEGVHAGVSAGLGLELFSMEDLIAMRAGSLPQARDLRQALTRLNTPSDLCVQLIGRELGASLAPQIHISACAAGTDAVGSAFRAIAEGRAEVMLAGGTDSMINPMGMGGFCRIGAMSTRNDSPETASRPFDAARDGFLLGEGAGFLVLEDEERARARGAQVLGRIAGYANSLDAYSVSDPHPEGQGALAAMRGALRSAGIGPEQLSAVSAHATSTPKNDPAESAAIRALLGPRAGEVPVFATKSMIGHLISAAGAVETVAAIQCMRAGQLHATLNLQKVAEGCALRHVVGGPERFELRYVLKNSFGFGGQNACIVIAAAQPGGVAAAGSA